MPDKRKYYIFSDLHLEFRQGEEKKFWEALPKDKEAKVALVAGDVTSFGLPAAVYNKHFVGLCERFEKVIYVPGNHEYYGSNPVAVEARLQDLEYCLNPVLKVLRSGEVYVHDGQRFIGDTLWFPDRPEVHMYRSLINDTVQIGKLFPWCFTQSSLFLLHLREHLQEDDIVISHHIPTDHDTLPQWKGHNTQAYFVNSACDHYFKEVNTVKPKAWIYGHTHNKHHFMYQGTEFICNPVGYPGENKYLPEAAEPCIHLL